MHEEEKSLAEGEQQSTPDLFDAFSVGVLSYLQPGDPRQAIMLVAVGDKYQVLKQLLRN